MSLTAGNTLAIDLDGGTTDDFTLNYVDQNPSDATIPYELNVAPRVGASVVKSGISGVAAALNAGSTIGSNSSWSSSTKVLAQFDKSSGAASLEWAGLSNRYLAGRIETAPGSGQFIYGWIQLSVPGNALAGGNPTSVTVHDWAYETTAGQSILAGQISAIPGGGAMALLSLGAAGLGRWRGRKRVA